MRLDLYHKLGPAEFVELRRANDALERIAAVLEKVGAVFAGSDEEQQRQLQAQVDALKASTDRVEKEIGETRPPTGPQPSPS
jgi:cob(I)alamin adenosyltransferase